MKKLFLATVLTLTYNVAVAHDYHHRHNAEWIAPLIIGGAIGYIIAKPQPVIINQPVQVVSPSGAQPLYQYQTVFDPSCNCQYQILVRIN